MALRADTARRRALAELGGVDLVVNNVGGSEPADLAGFREFSDERWHEMFDLNFFSAVRVTRPPPSRTARPRRR